MIAIDSPTYIRRMVREINLSLLAGRAVYAKDYPHNVRVVKVTGGHNIRKLIVEDPYGVTRSFATDAFFDDSGDICASRQ